MAEKGFVEHYVDYSAGRENAPTLTVMVGCGGSGKSTLVKGWVNWGRGDVLRLNRDDMRLSCFVDVPWSQHNEDFIRRYQQEGAKLALRMGRSVIIDDTNLVARTRQGWEELARDCRVKFRMVVMTTSFEECVERDSKREGKAHLGEAIIKKHFKTLGESTPLPRYYQTEEPSRALQEREALRGGEFPLRLPNADLVLCDVDGTLANHMRKDGSFIRSPFDEGRVIDDECHTVVADWVRTLYPHYNIVIVSGRHDTCGDATCMWLEMNKIPFDHILMRPGGNNDKDYVIKKEILDELTTVVPKDRIAFVLDDRPQVVKMWKENGLRVFPVAGTTDHSPNCTFEPEKKGWRHCPQCGALEAF